MGETIVVIFILMILIVFGLVIYYQFQSAGVSQAQKRYGGLKTIELTQVVTNMPELQCSFLKVSDVSCIDEVKATSLAKLLTGGNPKAFYYYRETLGTSKLEILRVYPTPASANEKILVYDNSKGLKNADPTFIPISLYNPIQKTNSFALLIATRYYS